MPHWGLSGVQGQTPAVQQRRIGFEILDRQGTLEVCLLDVLILRIGSLDDDKLTKPASKCVPSHV